MTGVQNSFRKICRALQIFVVLSATFTLPAAAQIGAINRDVSRDVHAEVGGRPASDGAGGRARNSTAAGSGWAPSRNAETSSGMQSSVGRMQRQWRPGATETGGAGHAQIGGIPQAEAGPAEKEMSSARKKSKPTGASKFGLISGDNSEQPGALEAGFTAKMRTPSGVEHHKREKNLKQFGGSGGGVTYYRRSARGHARPKAAPEPAGKESCDEGSKLHLCTWL